MFTSGEGPAAQLDLTGARPPKSHRSGWDTCQDRIMNCGARSLGITSSHRGAPALSAVLGALRLLAPQPLCGQGIPPRPGRQLASACLPAVPATLVLRSQPGRHQRQPGTGVATPATDTVVGAINECGRRPRDPWAHISLSTSAHLKLTTTAQQLLQSSNNKHTAMARCNCCILLAAALAVVLCAGEASTGCCSAPGGIACVRAAGHSHHQFCLAPVQPPAHRRHPP